MSRARGNALQNALADYLRKFWPHAESAGAGRNGSDVLGTPGVVWECKTADDFKANFKPGAWVKQSKEHATRGKITGHPGGQAVPVVVYYPRGIGAANTENTLAIVPLHVLMQLLQEGGYCD